MRTRHKRWILTIASTIVVATVAAGVMVLRGWPGSDAAPPAVASKSAREIALDYAVAFARGDAGRAARLTDEPRAARQMLAATRKALLPDNVAVKLLRVRSDGQPSTRAHARVKISWTFGDERVWTYRNDIPLVAHEGGWLVHWSPAVIHPELTGATKLAIRTGEGTAAAIAADGEPLLVWRGGEPRIADGVHGSVLLPAIAEVAAERAGGGWSIALVDGDGGSVDTLYGQAPRAADPLRSTVNMRVRSAAAAAVESVSKPAMLVAIQPSTGHVLAVAQNSAVGAAPRSLTGLYPPGSTFKIATATAVLRSGLANTGTVLPCPAAITIGERTITNAGEFALGEVPLRTAFAESCNTTFVKLAARLPPSGLADAASSLGLNASFVIPGVTTELGDVEPAAEPAQRVADGIGQGRVLASPFGVALMVATVARGAAVTPTLFSGVDTTVKAGYEAPPAGVLDALRTMMRAVVTSGTATELKGFGHVSGKTGTAEVAGGSAHGWFAGYRGDLAFATLVAHAGSSEVAVAVTGRFLGGL